MLDFSVNHMTLARASFESLLDVASDSGCAGIELRIDLDGELFGGTSPDLARQAATAKGLRLLALAEITSFNQFTETTPNDATALMETAAACGAETVSLIPSNDGNGLGRTERQAALSLAGGEIFAEHTGIVHISGVDNTDLDASDLRDEHRGLVNRQDRLENLEQLSVLRSQGYTSPISIEAFAPAVHAFTDPGRELSGSLDYIATSLAVSAA